MCFPGFLIVYEEARDEDQKPDEEEDNPHPTRPHRRPKAGVGAADPRTTFHPTAAAFSEATLVRTLEEYGIGRPSTYAPILGTLQQRGYVIRDVRNLTPTETGMLVNDLLVEHFPDILNVGFTAQMEGDLDRIAAGELPWVNVIRDFYAPFAEQVETGREEYARN